MISIRRESIINPTKKKTRNNCMNAYDRSLYKERNNNYPYHANSYKQHKEKNILCRIIRESMEID